MSAPETLAEARRLMTICNACRYCEGLCAVFPAMELRRRFSDADLGYLANLCHACGACHGDCQFSPPHAFSVNVPRTMATLRGHTYAAYAWPGALAGLFRHNGLAAALVTGVGVAAFLAGALAAFPPSQLLAVRTGPGAFFALVPHEVLVAMFGGLFLLAMAVLAVGLGRFWRAIGGTAPRPTSLWQAVADTLRLRYLDGGGGGCFNRDGLSADRRRLFHHLTFYGFLLCLAATAVATLYHFLLHRQAPYPWYDVPVLLGVSGGLGLLAGPLGLLVEKGRRDPALAALAQTGMDVGFLVMLMLTSLTGLALLAWRHTAAMGPLLAVHLGVVAALFALLPYGKFVHGLYRFLALLRYAGERPPDS